ncbi:MAG: hypothetical protein ABIJ74_02045 [archaeon]
MQKIEFSFRPLTPKTLHRPCIAVKFRNNNREDKLLCIVDSGADFTTIPIQAGFMLGINFNKSLAPEKIIEEWRNLNQSDNKQLNDFIKKITEKKFAVPINIGCACGKGTNGFLYSVEVEIGNHKKNLPIFWINADINPLLGRTGFFDKAKEVVFNARQNKGHFLME